MSLSNGKNLLGCAAATAAIGLLISPAPAQALPPVPLVPNDCASYQFPGGMVSLHYPNIGQTEFDTIAGGTHVDTKGITKYPQGGDMPGTVIGDINGSDIHLDVTRQGNGGREYTPLILAGKVGPDNRGHGTYTYRDGDSGTWDSIEPLKCVPAPPQEQPKPAPQPEEPKPLAPDNGNAAAQEAQAPQESAAPAPAPDKPCIPAPFGLNFPGAC